MADVPAWKQRVLADLPPLDPFDLAKLRESIRASGVRQPIVVDEDHIPLDGDNRAKIAAEFGADCPERMVSGLTDDEKYDYAITLNAARRQLTIEQRRHVWGQNRVAIAERLSADPRQSDRSIAGEVGSHHTTVAKVRDELEENGGIAILERKGRSEPKEPPAENVADHRNEVYAEVMIGYPCESDQVRMRGADPYPKASDRLVWPSGRFYVRTAAPKSEMEADILADEICARMKREMRTRPLKTMVRALV